MLKLLIIVGARPNFIKIAPLIEELNRFNKLKHLHACSLNCCLVHTGQHYDFEMSQTFFQDLKIPKPDYNLGVGSGSHAWQTAKVMEKIESVILKEKPDLIIVVGDVNSTLAGALVAAKLHPKGKSKISYGVGIPVAHIEAGLRSYNKKMPEEINRRLTDHISTLLFCPTKTAMANLKKEGIKKRVYNVGDIMYDALLKNIKIAQRKSKILQKLKLKSKDYFLLTIHRAENTDNLENLREIIEAIRESKEKIIFPIHPRTKKQLKKLTHLNTYPLTHLHAYSLERLQLINPVGYLDMLILEKNAKKILTDSGGIQKEAYWLKVPCITLRKETEWIETVKAGWNVLVGSNRKKILDAIKNFKPKKKQYKHFGDGKTAKKIVKILCQKIKN